MIFNSSTKHLLLEIKSLTLQVFELWSEQQHLEGNFLFKRRDHALTWEEIFQCFEIELRTIYQLVISLKGFDSVKLGICPQFRC